MRLILLLTLLTLFLVSAGYVSADSDIDNLKMDDLSCNITADYSNDCLITADSHNALKMSDVGEREGLSDNSFKMSDVGVNEGINYESYNFQDSSALAVNGSYNFQDSSALAVNGSYNFQDNSILAVNESNSFQDNSILAVNGSCNFQDSSALAVNERYNFYDNSTISLNSTNSKESSFFNNPSISVHVVFEGKKVYDLGDAYEIKVVDDNNNPVSGGEFSFFVDGVEVSHMAVDSDGIAGFKLSKLGTYVVKSVYTHSLINFSSTEAITVNSINDNSALKTTFGFQVPRWSGIVYELGPDGYVGDLGNNTYHLINFDGTRYTLHKEAFNDSNSLFNFLKTISNKPLFDINEIDLVENCCYMLTSSSFSDREWDYVARLSYGQLIINGNGAALKSNQNHNFLFVGHDANVVLKNLTIDNFNHVFMNYGHVLCDYVLFSNNVAYKFDKSDYGAVIHNYNDAYFKSCSFISNQALFWHFGKIADRGSILVAESYSTDIFDGCFFSNGNNFIDAKAHSTTVFYQNDKMGNLLKDCLFDPNACICVISNNVSSGLVNNAGVINCSDVNDLKNAIYVLNSLVPNPAMVINLKPGTYEIKSDWLKGTALRSFDWRDCYYYNREGLSGLDIHIVIDRYALDVGPVPITINGNGSTIKLVDGADNKDNHFAYIPYGSTLTINDVKFCNFNSVFHNNGNLFINRCQFENNRIKYKSWYKGHGGVFVSEGGNTFFTNCTFKSNFGEDDTNIHYLVNHAHVDYINCSFSDDNKIKASGYCSIHNDPIENVDNAIFNIFDNDSLEDMKSYILPSNLERKLLYCIVNFTADVDAISYLNAISSKVQVIVLQGNRYNIGDLTKLKCSSSVLCFQGFDFSNYRNLFENSKTCYFNNCTFSHNSGDYLLSNKGNAVFKNCSFMDNKCKNLLDSSGQLTLIDCIFSNDEGSEYGLVYNNGGSLSGFNLHFDKNSGDEIYNFNTIDYILIGCGSVKVITKQPMSNWKLDLIRSVVTLGVAAASGAGGYMAASLIPTSLIPTLGLAVPLFGSLVGFSGGLIYSCIEGSTFHDYSHFWDNILPFTMLGLCMAGAGSSLAKMNALDSSIDSANQVDNAGRGEIELEDLNNQGENVGINDEGENIGVNNQGENIGVNNRGENIEVNNQGENIGVNNRGENIGVNNQVDNAGRNNIELENFIDEGENIGVNNQIENIDNNNYQKSINNIKEFYRIHNRPVKAVNIIDSNPDYVTAEVSFSDGTVSRYCNRWGCSGRIFQ